MGITIHLEGEVENVERLVDAAKDLAKDFGFDTDDYAEDFQPEGVSIRGVLVHPDEGCESLELIFNGSGKLGNWFRSGFQKHELCTSRVFCKTQFAGPLLHLKLLDYLLNLEPYFSIFKLHDEAEVWPLLKKGLKANSEESIRQAYQAWGEMQAVFDNVLGQLQQLGWPTPPPIPQELSD